MTDKKRKSPYKFETHLNPIGDTVVTLCKGKNKVWLFNIGRDGEIQLDVYPENAEKLYKSVGLQTELDDNDNIVPVFVTSGHIRNKAIVERLDEIFK